MPTSPCYLFKNSYEFKPASDINSVPVKVRGIYVLFRGATDRGMSVVYIGMARGEKTGVRGRLNSHMKSKCKLWSHFSVFEVWDNITREQVEELEGLFRHIYRRDTRANKLNRQKRFRPLDKIRRISKETWE